MTKRTVTLIPGDSIGREVSNATLRLLEAVDAPIEFEEAPGGLTAFNRSGDSLPPETVESIRRNRLALKGRMATPVGEGYGSPNVRLRQALDVFAGVRPIANVPGVPSRYENVDIVFVRELTEDVYSGIEHKVYPGVVQGLKVTTRVACERIVHFAFRYCERYGRKKLTLVHKANIMKMSDGLFMRVGREIAEQYPAIQFETIIADNACMQLVKNPHRFDVLVAQNLFGDLLSDLAAGLVGGISAVWGCQRNASDLYVFESIHGIAPELEGKGVANPLPLIGASLGLLRMLKHHDVSTRVREAIGKTLGDGIRTADLGGSAGTEAFVDAIIERL